MQRKFKHTFTKSKMNQDLDARLLSSDEYREGVNISVSRAEADDVGALENILGNSLLSSLNSSSPFLTQIIGWYFNQDTNKVYIFDTNYQDNSVDQISNFCPVGTKNRILVVDIDSQVVSTIVTGRFLNFSWNNPINDVVILEDLMFWTDNRNQPRMINVKTAESNPSYYFNEDHVSVAKYNPFKPISLNSEYNPRAWGFNFNIAQYSGYNWNSIYSFFILDPEYNPTKEYQIAQGVSPSIAKDSNTVAALRNNIGCQGYLKSDVVTTPNFELYEFKVAATAISTFPDANGQKLENALMVFIDRDINGQISNALGFTTPSNPSASLEVSPLFFVDQTSKDVSSPWLRESQARITVRDTDPNGQIEFAPISGANGGAYVNVLYDLGTALVFNSLNKGGATGEISKGVYELPNHFPKNIPASGTPLTPDSSVGYIRVTHPKLDPLKYYVVTEASDPTATAPPYQFVKIRELSGFVNGTLSSIIDPSTLGLVLGDQLSFHWPNSFYDYEFPGDPNFLQDKFVRFSYRFKFDDGQYSLIAPFTQATFIPKQKGYFLKDIGAREYNENNNLERDNSFINQEDLAGERTINDFMENEVTNVVLNITNEYKINELANKLKIDEIDILYKSSDTNNINVIDTISITDESITTNSTNTFQYTYQSKSPIKTLREAETTRVYDLAPVRAKTLSASGNRIIYGNFFDKHTSPEGLGYFVCANQKMTPGSITQTKDVIIGTPKNNVSPYLPNRFANVSYPNHSLKQNRTYQVGLVLQDRYGRSSDVILSKFTKTNFTLRDGVYENDPLVFFGSTFFHEYLNSVTTPLTSQNSMTVKSKVYAGIVNWPGDSLKMLFTEELPRTISYANGYPGLYEDPFTSASMVLTPNVTGSGVSYIELLAGFTDNVQPGMQVQWATSFTDTTIKTLLVKSVVVNATYKGTAPNYIYYNQIELTDADGNYVTVSELPPRYVPGTPVLNSTPTPLQFIEADNPLGWYSYKVVVKQQEQDYYNVYLPSLLSGTPVIKPFKLKCSVASGSNIFTVDPIGTMEYLTFPLLRGMKLRFGTLNLFISNILNYTQFETTTNANQAFNATEFEFSTSSSIGIVNTTTLITDNANKVPPELNEASPVQQNFSTSNVELIPRYAFYNKWTDDGSQFNLTNHAAMPIFPEKQKLKVQSIGNFENLFPRGTYFGLYNADTDPPSGIIEDKFNIGQNANTVKPANEAPMIAAGYETTPVKSELEIYYESSTSGTVKQLNQLVRDNLVIPSGLIDSTSGLVLSSISISESLNFASGSTVANFKIVDQDGNILTYQQAEGFNISTSQYSNGTLINPAPFVVVATTNNEYKLTTTSTNPMYSSNNSLLNNVSFNINFTFLQFNVLPIVYTIPVTTTIQNVAPQIIKGINSEAATYYFWNNEGDDPPPKIPNSGFGSTDPDPWEFLSTGWNSTGNTNTSEMNATNGSNSGNINAGEELAWQIWVSFDNGVNYQNITATPVSGFGLSLTNYGVGKIINIGNFSGSFLSSSNSFYVEVRVVDQNGNGISTTIGSFKFAVVTRPNILRNYNAASILTRQNAGTQNYYPTAITNGSNWTLRSGSSSITNYNANTMPNPKPLPTNQDMIDAGFPTGTSPTFGSGSGMTGRVIGNQGQMSVIQNGSNYNAGDIVRISLQQVTTGNSTSILGNVIGKENSFCIVTPSLFGTNGNAPA
jgi:hypothetical protein